MDFPFCFAAVRLLGVERIGHYEHVIFETVKGAIDTVWSRAPETPAVEGRPEGSESEASNGQHKEPSTEEAPSKPDGEASMSQHSLFFFFLAGQSEALTDPTLLDVQAFGHNSPSPMPFTKV